MALNDTYPAHFAELDRLYQTAGAPVAKRLALLEQHQAIVVEKNGSLAALIGLEIFTGKADEAIARLQNRTFSLWEGGTQFNAGEAWADAHLVRGLQHFNAKQYREALADFEAALNPPKNLRAQERDDSRQAEIDCWIGRAHDALGETDKARQSWNAVIALKTAQDRSGGPQSENPLARSEQRYCRALAQQKLGETNTAIAAFHELVIQSAHQRSSPGTQDVRRTFGRNISDNRWNSSGVIYANDSMRQNETESAFNDNGKNPAAPLTAKDTLN